MVYCGSVVFAKVDRRNEQEAVTGLAQEEAL